MTDLSQVSDADLQAMYNRPAPSDVAGMVSAEAQRQGVDPDLALRIARQESAFDQGAVSPKGARGVMQLMPDTARDLGVDPSDLTQNIRGGVSYLKRQMDEFRDPRLAAAAYNAGPEAVRQHGGVPPYPETQAYVSAVAPDAPQSSDLSKMSDGDLVALYGAGDQPGAAAEAVAAPQPITPAQQINPAALPRIGQPSSAPAVSQTLGFLKGVADPVDRLWQRINGSPMASGIAGALGDAIPAASAARAVEQGLVHDKVMPYIAKQQAAGVQPGKLGEFGGNMLATVGIPGGPLLNGAVTGAALSKETDPGGIVRDALVGAAGGKIAGGAVGALGHAVSGVTDPMVRLLASKGVPLTIGQLAGGMAHSVEDKLTSVPILGDMVRNAQRAGIAGTQRAAYNDTLGRIGDALPASVELGHDAYTYTKKALGDAYDAVLEPLSIQKDAPFNQAIRSAKVQIAKIGDPSTRDGALAAIKAAVDSRFDKGGAMAGQALKDAQSDLGSHINDLRSATGPGATWSRNAASALQDVKGAIEGLVSRTDPAAGQRLAQVNSAYSLFKPLENATKTAAVKDGGQFTLNQFAQGVAKGKSASTLAAGDAPHQELATAASKVLPSTVPDSGTAGRSAMMMLGGALLGGAHHLPVAGPFALPLGGLIGGSAALYTRAGQKALTALATTRNDAARTVGHYMGLLAPPAGTAGAVGLSRQ